MIYWQGRFYVLNTLSYNGTVFCYLLDGRVTHTQPKYTKVRGHIVTEDGVVVLLRRTRAGWAIVPILLLVIGFALWPRYKYVPFQVTYAERPVWQDGVLYCNVINEADIEVTVQFANASDKSMGYTLAPSEALPYIYIDFVPDIIRYNGTHDFPLEVQND